MQPQVPIDVDQNTGVWHTDGLPMLYVPRHFFNNLHLGIEQSLGDKTYAKMLYASGYKSAWYWCESESKTHDIHGVAVYTHYLLRLSQRGWGKFQFIDEQLAQGHASIRVDNSSFVLHKKHFHIESKNNACYMFSGWFAGAADWVAKNMQWQYNFHAKETFCAACQDEKQHCEFTISSK